MGRMINWLLFRHTKLITVEVPVVLHHALETVTYMHNNSRSEDDQLTRDDIVTIALAKYLQENLWTNSVEDVRMVTQIITKDLSLNAGGVKVKVK